MPAPAGRPALGPSVEGRASLYLGPQKVLEPHGADGAAAGGVLLLLKDLPGATSPKASSFSARFLEKGEGPPWVT